MPALRAGSRMVSIVLHLRCIDNIRQFYAPPRLSQRVQHYAFFPGRRVGLFRPRMLLPLPTPSAAAAPGGELAA